MVEIKLGKKLFYVYNDIFESGMVYGEVTEIAGDYFIMTDKDGVSIWGNFSDLERCFFELEENAKGKLIFMCRNLP